MKTVKNLPRLTRRPLPQTQNQVQVSANAARLRIILPHRQKWQTQKSRADGQSKYLNTQRKKTELADY